LWRLFGHFDPLTLKDDVFDDPYYHFQVKGREIPDWTLRSLVLYVCNILFSVLPSFFSLLFLLSSSPPLFSLSYSLSLTKAAG
jgi:hypothetical protein